MIPPAIAAEATYTGTGYLVAVPFAVASASPAFGRWLTARGVCAIPEEFEPFLPEDYEAPEPETFVVHVLNCRRFDVRSPASVSASSRTAPGGSVSLS